MRATAVIAAFMAILMVALYGMPGVANAQTPAQDTLVVGVQNDTPNLHPWDIATNSVWKGFLWRNWVYESLFSLNPDGSSIYPALASDYTVDTPDGRNVTVHIRTGVTFTDGVPMNATDVIFSFQVSAFNDQLGDVEMKSIVWPTATWPRWNATTSAWGAAHPSHVGIELIDDHTVKFHLRQSYSMFYFGTLTNPVMPSHIWKDHMVSVDTTGMKLPDGTVMTAGTEFDYDKDFGSRETDVQATIGTGPWILIQWTRLTSASLRVYDNYWGKSQSVTYQGTVFPFFPRNLRAMEFKEYGTLDVAVLALKSGEVQMVPWNLPLGFYNDLRKDPRMGFGISASDGFFYLAFNMRKAPMNDLAFRRAVSMAIDKDFIVDRLLGGYGIKGQVPISPINPGYINSSAVTPGFDLAQAGAILDAAGYTIGADGWRTMPGGAPLKLSILTPAKDYDPVRADSGIMISNNLKAIHLNIDSAPTAFDAIVSAVFVAVQFDMYILGWVTLGPFPELYLEDFFGCRRFAELGGDNTPGFCNPKMEAELSTLNFEMDNAKRIQAAKDAEGILTAQLPYNTLYDPRWIEGFRADVWGGWLSINGEIFNFFSLSILGPPGSTPVPTGPLTISLDGPGTGLAGQVSHFQVYAVQGGLPGAGVDVNVSTSTGDFVTVTTGANGYADVPFTLPYVSGKLDFVASAHKGTDTGGDIYSMNILLPNDIAQLTLSANTPVVAPGGTATVTAKVTNKAGVAISGANVSIIPQLILGTVTPAFANTDANGQATFTYTAPPATLIPNKNQYDFFKASVDVPTKPLLPETKKQTLVIGVQNPVYDWYLVNITSVSAYVIDTAPGPIPLTSDVTVAVTKQDGTPVANTNVNVTMSNTTAISVDAPAKLTNAGGTATFTFTAQTAVSTAVSIDFTVQKAFFAQAGLSLLVTDRTTSANATFISMPSRFVDPNSPVPLTVTVYDENGNPANGAQVNIYIPYNDVGNPVKATLAGWSFIGSVGTFFAGTTDATGKVSTSFSTKSFPADNVVTVETGIFGFGPKGSFIMGSPANTYMTEQVVQKRNKIAMVSSFAMTPILLTPGANTTTLTVAFQDLNGNAAAGTNVTVYRGTGDLRTGPGRLAKKIGWFLTDASGQISVPWTEPARQIPTPLGFTAVITSNNYALGGQFGSVPFEAFFPFLLNDPSILVTTGLPASTIVRAGSPQTYTVNVTDYHGAIVQGALVVGKISESSGNVSARTDGTGHAAVQLVPGTFNPANTEVWETTLTVMTTTATTTVQYGTMVALGVFAYSNLAVPSSASVGKASTISVDVQNTGPVTDNALVTLLMDGNFYAAQQVALTPGQKLTVSFTYVPSDTSQHTFSIATTSLSGSVTAGGGGGDLVVTAGVGIVLLIVGVLIGYLMGKRAKPTAPKAEEEMPTPEKPPEMGTPPEQKS